MIRIAHILGRTDGSDAELTLMNYYRAIDREQVQFDFFICKGSQYLPVEEIKALSGKIFVLPSERKKSRLKAVLEQLLSENSYETLHCHSLALAKVSLKAAKAAGVKTRILHSHNESKKAGAAKKYATAFLASDEKCARKLLGAVPVVKLNEQAPPVTVARLLPAAVDAEKYRFSKEKRSEAKKKLNIPAGCTVFGSVGKFSRDGNQSFLIDVFKEIVADNKNSVLVLAGTGKDAEYLKARAITCGVADRVLFLRRATEELYGVLDCFLLPSKQETFPFCAVEAQAAGVYCIFSENVSAKLTDSAQVLTLKAGFADWACAALCCAKLKNHKAAKQIAAAGYDIKENAAELQKYYLSI